MNCLRSILICSVLAIATHAPLANAQPPTTLSAVDNPITQTFLGFGYYGSWLMVAFDSIPANKYDFKPSPLQ